MAFRKTSIGISRPVVTNPIEATPQIGDVNSEGLVWDGRAWVKPEPKDADPSSSLA